MSNRTVGKICAALGLVVCGTSHADLVIPLGAITAPASIPFSNAPVSLDTAALLPYNFLDQVTFTLTATALVSSLTASFIYVPVSGQPYTFGIDNLQVNLLNSANMLVSPSWQTVSGTNPFMSLLSSTGPTSLAADTYKLQIRGTLLPPGSYAGTLIAAAPSEVPLPAVIPMLLAGVGVLGFAGRRRREDLRLS